MANKNASTDVGKQIAKLIAEAKQLECEAQQKTAAAAAKYAEICELASASCPPSVVKPRLSVVPSRAVKVKRNLRNAKTGVKTFPWQRACKPARRAA